MSLGAACSLCGCNQMSGLPPESVGCLPCRDPLCPPRAHLMTCWVAPVPPQPPPPSPTLWPGRRMASPSPSASASLQGNPRSPRLRAATATPQMQPSATSLCRSGCGSAAPLQLLLNKQELTPLAGSAGCCTKVHAAQASARLWQHAASQCRWYSDPEVDSHKYPARPEGPGNAPPDSLQCGRCQQTRTVRGKELSTGTLTDTHLVDLILHS